MDHIARGLMLMFLKMAELTSSVDKIQMSQKHSNLSLNYTKSDHIVTNHISECIQL